VSVRTRGCSGNAFHLEYATVKQKNDEEVDAHGVKVWVDNKAILKVLVSEPLDVLLSQASHSRAPHLTTARCET